MKKLNLYIVTVAGELTVLPNVTTGQYRAVGDALGKIYPGATIITMDASTKPEKANLNHVLKAAGFDKFGDYVGVKADGADDDTDEGSEDGSEDTEDTEEAGSDSVIPVMDFTPKSFGSSLA